MILNASAASGDVPLKVRARLVLALTALNSALYLVTNAYPLSTPRLLPTGAIEAWLGFHAWTIWPYWALLLMAPVLALGIRTRALLGATLTAYAIALTLNVTVWIAWPTRLPRVALEGPLDPATAAAWRLLLALDRDTNCFPSGHVTVPLVIAAGYCAQHPSARRWLPALLLVLLPSVITTGQHYAVDVLGGAATAAIGLVLGGRALRADRGRARAPSPPRR